MRDGFCRLARVALAIVILVIATTANLSKSAATHRVTRIVLAAHDAVDVERHGFVPRAVDAKAVEGDGQDNELEDHDELSGATTLGGQLLLPSRTAERAECVPRLAFAASRVSISAPLARGPPA